jgi:hypothetical protein
MIEPICSEDSALDFEAISKRRASQTEFTSVRKGKEYANSANNPNAKSRFYNFDEIAKMNNCTPEQALWALMSKQLVSVKELVECPDMDFTIEYLDEKMGDVDVYMKLLEALFHRRKAKLESLKVKTGKTPKMQREEIKAIPEDKALSFDEKLKKYATEYQMTTSEARQWLSQTAE